MFLLITLIAATSGPALAGPPPPRAEPRILWTRSSMTPSAGIVLGGDTDSVAVFEGCAVGTLGSAEVHTLEVRNCLAWNESGTGCAVAEEYQGSDAPVGVIAFDYWSTDGSLRSADGYFADGVAVFSALDMWVPPCRRGTMLLPMTVAHNSADPAGALPGDTYRLNLVSGRGSAFEAIDYRTGRAIVRATPIVDAMEMVFHDSVPVFGLHSESPSGATAPGLQEALRIVVDVDGNDASGYYEQSLQAFELVSTDNAGSGWNTCGELADNVWEFAVLDSDGLFYDLGAAWDFYAWDGTPCADAPDEELGYAVANAFYGLVTWSSDTLSVFVDSTGASASADDTMSLGSMSQEDAEHVGLDALIWTDGVYDGEFDGTYVSTEVSGNILGF